MAGYTPNYGAGAPVDDPPTYHTYFDYLSSTFVDHCTSLPARLEAADETPRPLDPDRYYDEYDSNQSNTCARMAVEFYNEQECNSAIVLDRAKGSHKFFSEGTAYFHVNFKAAFDGTGQHGPYYTFFAEVNGPGGDPENVTRVVQFHTKEERRTRDNCLYCTGLRHPEQGGFVGHKIAGTGDGYDDDEEEEEEEEVEGSGDDDNGKDGNYEAK